MIEFAILRHGQTQWNLDKRYQGSVDTELLPESLKTFEESSLPRRFQNHQFCSSPLKRARQSLEALIKSDDYQVIDDLKERDFGLWEGLTAHEIKGQFPQADNGFNGLDYNHHLGETMRQVQNRVCPWLFSLKKNTFAMAHKALITALYAKAVNWDIESPAPNKLDFQKIHVFKIDNQQVELEELNVEFLNG